MHLGRAADGVVVAGGELCGSAEGLKVRLGGDDVDDASRGRLAEQGALGTFQHLDLVHVAEVVETDAVAGPVHPVDDDADGGLQPGVVADGADAADASGRGGGRRCLEVTVRPGTTR